LSTAPQDFKPPAVRLVVLDLVSVNCKGGRMAYPRAGNKIAVNRILGVGFLAKKEN
jgi:hypothetical protein